MNSIGTSIANRIYRIVINQILHSPSIYYWSKLDYNEILCYTDTIISYWKRRGVEFEIDKNKREQGYIEKT